MILTFDPFTVLLYSLVILAIIALLFLIPIFYRAYCILTRVERITKYAEKVEQIISLWEDFSVTLIERIFKLLLGKRK